MTYKQKVIFELETSDGHTCAEIVKWLQATRSEDKMKNKKSLMSTISSILYKMWKNEEVYIYQYRKGIRGGSVYKLNKEI